MQKKKQKDKEIRGNPFLGNATIQKSKGVLLNGH
jgi:hypothetical protein